MFDLSGRVALVTGAGRNIGAGIAHALTARGASLAVNDLHPERAEAVCAAIEAGGGRALALPFDVCDPEAVAAGVAAASDALGAIDILVNNAGVPEGMGLTRFRDGDPEQWRRIVDLNLHGVVHCCRAVVDGMCERGWGRIVTISSAAGQMGLPIGVALYGAGKGGAIAFMRHLALELARDGVTANTLALGLMDNVPEEAVAGIAATIPVGRLGAAEDVGAAVVYLASSEAGWMTGQTIGLNGGSHTG